LAISSGDGLLLAVRKQRVRGDAAKVLGGHGKVETEDVFHVVPGIVEQLLQTLRDCRERSLCNSDSVGFSFFF